MGFISLLSGRIWAILGIAAGIAAAGFGAYMVIDHRGYARCEGDSALAALHAQEEAHQVYLAEVARGEEIARKLAETQRRLDAKQAEYLRYANAITGNCPASLGLLTSAASGGQVALPDASGELANPPATNGSPDIAARIIGANVTVNYARFKECLARYDALLDWHEKAVK